MRLLLPHIANILTYIKGTVDNLKTQLNKRQDSCKELNILSRYFTSLICFEPCSCGLIYLVFSGNFCFVVVKLNLVFYTCHSLFTFLYLNS